MHLVDQTIEGPFWGGFWSCRVFQSTWQLHHHCTFHRSSVSRGENHSALPPTHAQSRDQKFRAQAQDCTCRIFDCLWQYSYSERSQRFWPDHHVLAHCPKAHCCTRSCILLASIRLKPEMKPEDDLDIAQIPRLCSTWHHIWIIQQYCTSSNSLLYWIFKNLKKCLTHIPHKAVVCWSGCNREQRWSESNRGEQLEADAIGEQQLKYA